MIKKRLVFLQMRRIFSSDNGAIEGHKEEVNVKDEELTSAKSSIEIIEADIVTK